MIEQVIRLFTGFDYGLRRDSIILPNQIVGRIAGIETVYDARMLFFQLVEDGYMKEKPSQPSKLGTSLPGWILTDKGWGGVFVHDYCIESTGEYDT